MAENGRKLSELRVCDLKAELEKRKLETVGAKASLVERLEKALKDEGIDPAKHIFDSNDRKKSLDSPMKKVPEQEPKVVIKQEPTEEMEEESEEIHDKNGDYEIDQVGDVDDECVIIEDEMNDHDEGDENGEGENGDADLSKGEGNEDAEADTNNHDNDESINLTIGEDEQKLLHDERIRRQSSNNGTCPQDYYFSKGLCYPIKQTVLCPEGYQLQGDMCYLIAPQKFPLDTTTRTPIIVTDTPETPTCPEGYKIQGDMCYPIELKPCPFETTTRTPSIVPNTPTTPLCPEGYNLQGNECYANSSTTTSSPTTALPPPTTTSAPTTNSSPPLANIRCPFGSVLIKGKCRKIVCPFGEYVNGRCLQAICPEGTVWRGHSCQTPGFVTTILEIENVFVTEARAHPGKVNRVNVNNIEYHTDKPEASTSDSTVASIVTTESPPLEIISNDCCAIFTPRTCKKYGKKWICFNNRLKRCDAEICKYPTMYLKIPSVVHDPPLLIMPPNPPLEACPVPNCEVADIVDCSGCPQGRRERCSSYCYRYICPQGTCGYLDYKDFCQAYPGEVGCTRKDGCIWGWCGENF